MTVLPDTGRTIAAGAAGRRRVASVGAVVVAAAALLYAVVAVTATDPGDAHLAGDQASFLLTALSVQGGDLSYDSVDHERWTALGWDPQPRGLFVQRNEHGWAVAKPIGYSIVLAPAVAAFGHRGVTVTGAVLLMLYAAAWYLACRLRWARSTSFVVAVTATVFSHAWFYAYPAHADLFVAVVTAIAAVGMAYAHVRADHRAFVVGAIASGLLVTEKLPALLALVPMLIIGARHLRRRHALVGVCALMVSAIASIAPYLYYSDGASWSPYGGDRYYVTTVTPWSGGSVDDLLQTRTDEVLTASYVLDRVTDPSPDLPAASLTYVIGRHTGVMTFMPIVPLMMVASILTVLRRRSRARAEADGSSAAVLDDEEVGSTSDTESVPTETEEAMHEVVPSAPTGTGSPSLAGGPMVELLIAATASIALYAAFYLVLFTSNYYGGGQSIGSRYFLQFSVVAALVPVAAGVSARLAYIVAACSVTWSVIVLPQHYANPDRAFVDLWRTSVVQRLLPYETTQKDHDGLW